MIIVRQTMPMEPHGGNNGKFHSTFKGEELMGRRIMVDRKL